MLSKKQILLPFIPVSDCLGSGVPGLPVLNVFLGVAVADLAPPTGPRKLTSHRALINYGIHSDSHVVKCDLTVKLHG